MFHEVLENNNMNRLFVHPARPFAPLATALVAALTLTGCAGSPAADTPSADGTGSAAQYPLSITNCGVERTITTQPTSVVTLNQGATEVVLALGLQDQLAGTAYLDDAVPETWQAAYDAVPVLSAEYPSHEALLGAEPDFVYASYASAFEAKVAGSQDELAAESIGSYLSPFYCEQDPAETSFESVWGEVTDVATALGHPEAAERLVSAQRDELTSLAEDEAGSGLDVLWLDAGDKTPSVGAGDGGPQLVMDAVGATNVFAHLSGNWADASWESVLAADPDVIVLSDAAWSPAEDKRQHLESDPVLQDLTAVKSGRFVVLPFSETTPGVRLVDGATSLAEQLDELELQG